MAEVPAREAVERVLKVPDALREFVVPLAAAKRMYGLDETWQPRLLDLGLPHRGVGEDMLFDRLDMENLSAALRLPALYWSAMRRWAGSLGELRSRRACRVELRWKCPTPGHDGECDFAVFPELGRVAGISSLDGSNSVTFDAELENQVHDFGPELDPTIREAVDLTFHRLPAALTEDVGFLREHRLADCRSAARHLLKQAAGSGLTVRPAWGYFMVTPQPFPHAWLEIRVAGSWVPADPFFLAALQRWGLVSREDWPLSRSPRGLLWRLGVQGGLTDFPIVNHGRHLAPSRLIVF